MPYPQGRNVILTVADGDAIDHYQMKPMKLYQQSLMDESGYHSEDTDSVSSYVSCSDNRKKCLPGSSGFETTIDQIICLKDRKKVCRIIVKCRHEVFGVYPNIRKFRH